MNRPIVSVVVAAFNAGEFLRIATSSVLEQKVDELELIVVDDGSTDGSTSFLHDIADPRVKVITQANAGQTVAKNMGIAAATGKYVGFCDADDYWYEDKLEKQLRLFDDDAELKVVYSAAQMIDENGSEISTYWPPPHEGQVLREMFMTNFVPFGTALVDRSCLQSVGGFDERLGMGIDWDLWLRIAVKGKFGYVPSATYAYRVWAGQMSSNWEGRYTSAFRIMGQFVRENPGLIDEPLQCLALSNTYANRARARYVGDRVGGVIDACRALRYSPSYSFAWRTLARVVTGRKA